MEVKIGLLRGSSDHNLINGIPTNRENKSTCSDATGNKYDLDLRQDLLKISRDSFDGMESVSGNASIIMEDSKSDIPLQSIIHEQGSKTASLQASSDKGTPGSTSHLKPERNQVLPRDGMDAPSQHCGNELNHEIKTIKMNDELAPQNDQVVKNVDHCPISPSLLHNSTSSNSFSKDNK